MKLTICLVVLSFSVIELIRPANSIGCYNCKETDHGCGDPFNYVTSVVEIVENCNFCTKQSYVMNGVEHISRVCATDSLLQTKCIQTIIGGYQGFQCACDTELCNGATTTRFGLAAALFAVIAVVIRLVIVT